MQPELRFKLRKWVRIGCVAFALIFLGGFAIEGMAQSSGSAQQVMRSPLPRDYAQALQIPSASASNYPKEWYRLALPISSACFLLSFAVWSLKSIGNQAVRPLPVADEGTA